MIFKPAGNAGPWIPMNSSYWTNPLWSYFLKDSVDINKMYCKVCSKALKYVHGRSNPSNLVRHLRIKHDKVYNEYMEEKVSRATNNVIDNAIRYSFVYNKI